MVGHSCISYFSVTSSCVCVCVCVCVRKVCRRSAQCNNWKVCSAFLARTNTLLRAKAAQINPFVITNIDTKIRIFNACVKSVLLYGCETWLVTKEIRRKIENLCLRYILRIWWPNIISNKDLWKVTGQEDINVAVRKRKFRWIGHTLRKEDGEIRKAALLWNPQGNRKRGRPRNSWRRSVIKEAGRSWNELSFLAANRQKWKGLIDNPCS